MNDKEICLGLVSTSHDQHIGKILKKEDEARCMELARTVELVLRFTSGGCGALLHRSNREAAHVECVVSQDSSAPCPIMLTVT